MGADSPKTEVSEIAPYYQVLTPKDLIGGFEQRKPLDSTNATLYEKAMNLLINSDRVGAFTTDDMLKQLKDFSAGEDASLLYKIIQIYSDASLPPGAEYGKVNDKYVPLSSMVKASQDKAGSKLGVILSNSPYVSLNVRHLNHVVLFLSSIPTVEFSKAVPFVDVNFQFDRPALSPEDRHQIPSLIKFLEGAIVAKGASKDMATAYETVVGDKKVSEIDMSIFTSPQTLVNPGLEFNPSSKENTIAAEVGDKFRPLASLHNITIQVVASPSYTVAYKWMKMELILHDRTRLAEIADLIRPNVYVGTTMAIRYGWSHPDDPKDNPYAKLINSMRVEERYGIKNASYSFDDVGQVKINLELAMLGENQLWISKTSENQDYKDLSTRVETIKSRIYDLIQGLGISVEPDTRAYQVMNFVNKGTSADIDDKELEKKIREFTNSVVKKNSTGPNKSLASELAELLDTAVKGKDKSLKGLKEKLQNSVTAAMAAKKQLLRNSPDPFLPDPDKASSDPGDPFAIRYSKDLKTYNAIRNPKDDKKRIYNYASLAKIFSMFVLQPLQVSEKFDEVQVVFYPFNNYCGLAGGTNIAHFPIELKVFDKVIDDYLHKKGSPDMTCAEFGKLLNDAFIADPSSIAYGMTNSYKKREGVEIPKPKQESTLEQAHDKLLGDNPQTAGGTWKNPTVEFYIECLTRNDPAADVKARAGKLGPGSILRIHVYDKQSTPWDGFLKLKGAQSRLNSSVASATKKGLDGKTTVQQLVQAVNDPELKKQLGLGDARIEVDPATGVMNPINFNAAKVKRLISSFVPTLTYGTNATGLIRANVQSIQDPRLSTVNMQRTNWGSSTTPAGGGVAGLPLRVIPGQVNVTMIGCPLLSLNQQFFLDFGTNTDIDNFYGLVELTHTISPGRFDSSAKFIWMDAYGAYENVALKLQSISEMIKKNVNK